jgi:CelD/BcsL family acetyltransferase involved in cellulose biosynthesis
MTYSGTPLLDPGRAEEAMAAMLTAVARQRRPGRGRILVLDEVAESGPADRAVENGARSAGLPIYRYQTWERPYLVRRPEAVYNSVHTKKDLRNMARLRRRLDTDVGGEVHLVDRSDDPSVVDDLVRLESAGYKADIGVAMSTVPGEVEYFREMCDRFRKANRLVAYALEGNGVVCAVIMFLRSGDGLMMIKVSYDESFARSSPGLQLHLDVIQHFHDERDAQWIDVCTYEGNHTLLRMYLDRISYCSYFVPLGRNPIDRLAARTFMAVRPLHTRLRHTVGECRRRVVGERPGVPPAKGGGG